MPFARRPTHPPEAAARHSSVFTYLSFWTSDVDDDDDDAPQLKKLPLGYTCLAQADRSAPVTGWRTFFNSESDTFNAAIGGVIIANAIVIGLEADYGHDQFAIAEHFFNTVFVLEMFTRISQLGCEYFTTLSYLFDCSLVVTGSLDLWILPAMTGDAGGDSGTHAVGGKLSVLRLVRILRLLRVLRVIRLLRMFGHLLLMVKGLEKAIEVVVLLFVIVFIMIYALSIVCTQIIGHNAKNWGDDADAITEWFGCIPNSMATLFFIMMGSSWDPMMRLLTEVYPTVLVLALFASYMIVNVAFMALIIGLISESLFTAQQEFKQHAMNTWSQSKKVLASEYREELRELLGSDTDDSGCVGWLRLKQAVRDDSELVSKLTAAGVQISLDGLLALVDHMSNTGQQNVNIDHFVEKLINLSGSSSASSVVDLKYDLDKNRRLVAKAGQTVQAVKNEVAHHRQQMDDLTRKMDDVLSRLK